VREYRCLFPMAQGKASDPLTVSQGKTSDTSTNSQGKTSDPLQGKASDPSKVKPAAPEVKGPLEVTAAPIPDEVILTTNSFGNKQTNEQTTEPSAPRVTDEKNFSEVNAEVWSLVQHLNPTASEGVLSPKAQKEVFYAEKVVAHFEPTGVLPIDLVEYTKAHYQNKPGKRGLVIRSCQYFWVTVLNDGTSDTLVNDYCTHGTAQCPDCKAWKIESWEIKKRRMEQAMAQARWVDAENQRLAQLEKFDFRAATTEDIQAFKPLREGWAENCFKEAITPKKWGDVVTHPAIISQRHASAAILFCLQQGTPISWDGFCILVEQIKELDTPCRLESYQATHA